MKREKTKYPGVFYREQERLDGLGTEKMYYIRYRRGGRGTKEIEEPCGRETEGMTAAKANGIRALRMTAREETNKERRQAQEEANKQDDEPLTLAHLWELYQETGKRIIERQDRYLWHYLDPLHNRLAESISTKDVDSLLRKLQKTPSKHIQGAMLSAQTQKHILALLKRMLKYADAQGLSPSPVGLKITMPKVDNIKTEAMSVEQMAAYWRALNEETDQNEAAILKIAILTGIRRTALFSLEWDDLDFERQQIRLRGETAKSGKTQFIPMNNAVESILRGIAPIVGNPLVWPSPVTGKRRDNITRMARRVRDKAGLPKDFRPMHGLRHAFASFLASSGKCDLYTLQRLLTHESPQMTQRYAHLADEALKRAASVASSMID